jgi:hypothetical protein
MREFLGKNEYHMQYVLMQPDSCPAKERLVQKKWLNRMNNWMSLHVIRVEEDNDTDLLRRILPNQRAKALCCASMHPKSRAKKAAISILPGTSSCRALPMWGEHQLQCLRRNQGARKQCITPPASILHG